MSTPLPFQLQISGRPVLLIGSGEAADAKARLLTERGAVITHWPTPPSAEQIQDATEANRTAASRFVLVIIAEVCDWTRALMPWLEQERLLLNAVDAPELSDGFIPAIVSRGRVQIGIGTGGSSPVLARFIRTRLEQVLPQGLEELAELADRWQLRVRRSSRTWASDVGSGSGSCRVLPDRRRWTSGQSWRITSFSKPSILNSRPPGGLHWWVPGPGTLHC